MLEALGIVFLALVAAIALLAGWVIVRIRRGMQQQAYVSAIEEGMTTPSIVLEAADTPALVNPETVAALARQAEGLGATSCGSFDAAEAGARLLAYAMDTPPVYIVIYDHDQVEPWTDVLVRLDEERSFTASTVPEIARGAPRPPQDEIMYFAPGTDTGVLVRAAAERAEGETTLPAAPGDFRETFEAAAETSRQYIQEQTVSQAWLDAIAEDAGVELTGHEAEQINFSREATQVWKTGNACLRSLAENGEYTAAEWNDMRDSLVAVWDEMPNDYVASVFYDHVDLPEELEDALDALEEERGPARERVARFNAMLPEDRRLIHAGTVTSPVSADIYRSQLPSDPMSAI